MSSLPAKAVALLVLSAIYWQIANWIMGVMEPWDAGAYWYFWYPISVGLAGIAGVFLGRHGWLAGMVIIFAQIPIMWIGNPVIGPLWLVGLLFLCALAIPAVAVSTLTGRKADRIRSTL